MNFDFTEEQNMLRETVRSFVDKEIVPYIREWDRSGGFPREIFDKLRELGLMGVCIPEKYGGSGMDYNSLAIVCEELERGDTAFRTAVSVHTGLNSLTLLQWGTEEQKQKYLVPQAKGEKIGAFGLTEPAAGSDVASIQTTAKKRESIIFLTVKKHGFPFVILPIILSYLLIPIKQRNIMGCPHSLWNGLGKVFHLKLLKEN